MRIVSMLPSATEIVYALGLGDELVGVTFECDHPATARRDHTVVVGGLDTSGLTPAEIDAHVRAQVAAGVDLYSVREQALAGLDPDLILTQDLCRVCAIPSGRVVDALDYLGCRADVVSLDPHSLDDVLETILEVGRRTGVDSYAETVVARLQLRLARVRGAVAELPRPRVAVVEWVDPPFTAGHWVPDLVVAAGGLPVGAAPGGRSTASSWEALAAEQPDVVLVAPCGFALAAAVEQAAGVLDRLPARAAVWAIDADGLVVRPGPRLVDGVEALASVLHPDVLPVHPGVALVRG